MKKIILSVISTTLSIFLFAQKFPQDWQGEWSGILLWTKARADTSIKVPMKLSIQPLQTGNWSWKIQYGDNAADNRPYQLLSVDSLKGHWKIDEQNGIILDQYYINNTLYGSFTVGKSTIINQYRLEEETLHIEMLTIGLQEATTTGTGSESVPNVQVYPVYSSQKALLKKDR